VGDVAHVTARLFAALRQPCRQLGRQAFRRLQIGKFAQGRHAQPRRIEACLCAHGASCSNSASAARHWRASAPLHMASSPSSLCKVSDNSASAAPFAALR